MPRHPRHALGVPRLRGGRPAALALNDPAHFDFGNRCLSGLDPLLDRNRGWNWRQYLAWLDGRKHRPAGQMRERIRIAGFVAHAQMLQQFEPRYNNSIELLQQLSAPQNRRARAGHPQDRLCSRRPFFSLEVLVFPHIGPCFMYGMHILVGFGMAWGFNAVARRVRISGA